MSEKSKLKNMLTSVNKNSPLKDTKLASTSNFLKRREILAGASAPTSVLKKAAKKTVIGKVLDTAVKVGAGVGAGYEYAKSKFKDKEDKNEKVDKKSMGGMADYIKDLL